MTKTRTSNPRPTLSERGQTLVEFALIAPVLMILIMACVDLARVMETHVTIQEAARDAARYAVTGRIDCAGPATPTRDLCIVQTVKDDTSSLTNPATVSTTYQSWTYPNYADPPVANNAGAQCDAVQVKVTYDYKPATPIIKFFVSHVTAHRHRANGERALRSLFDELSGL